MILKDFSSLQTIPGFKAILKAVLQSQIQTLVEQLHSQTGEESLLLTASTTDGSMCFLGSGTGQGFLEGREEIKSQFLTHCLKGTSRKHELQTNQLCHRNIQVIPAKGVRELKINGPENFNHHITNIVQHNSIGKVLSIQSNGQQFPLTISNLETNQVDLKNTETSGKTFCTINQLGNIGTVRPNDQNTVPVVSLQTVFVDAVSGSTPSKVLVNTDASTRGLTDIDKHVSGNDTSTNGLIDIDTHVFGTDTSSSGLTRLIDIDKHVIGTDTSSNGLMNIGKHSIGTDTSPSRPTVIDKHVFGIDTSTNGLIDINKHVIATDTSTNGMMDIDKHVIATDTSTNGMMDIDKHVFGTDTSTDRLINIDKHVFVDLKDKTKKTLSSKIEEITERIRKDDPLKSHEMELQAEYSLPSMLNIKLKGANSNPETPKPRQRKTGKSKDTSRASHRKPKLPRYNIGAASDEEEGGQSEMDTTLDILDLAVSMEDSDSSFAHISLDELRDGVILKENETDIPLVDYVCYNMDESNKSLLHNVFNLKNPDDGGHCIKTPNSSDVTKVTVQMPKDKTVSVNFKTVSEKSLINKHLWFKCSSCPERFPNKDMLKQHMQTVTHSQKKYTCDLCGWKFGQLRDKDRHRRIHTGEKPFFCDVCNKAFARKDNLKLHKRKHICHKMGSNFSGILTSSAFSKPFPLNDAPDI